jgi:hypothetical protein
MRFGERNGAKGEKAEWGVGRRNNTTTYLLLGSNN